MTMIRFISVITFLAASLLSFAQTPSLKGTWRNDNEEMGVKGVFAFEFGGDTEGPVRARTAVTSSTPITVRYKDEDAPDEIREKMEKSLRDLAESMKAMPDVSTYKCAVTKDILTLSRVNSEGKAVTKKYRKITNQ